NALASSSPKASIKAAPVVAAPEKSPPAAAVNPEISKPDSSKLSNTLASSSPKAIIKDSPVVAAPEKATLVVVDNPVKDLTAVKVRQQVSSEKGKNESSSYAPKNI